MSSKNSGNVRNKVSLGRRIAVFNINSKLLFPSLWKTHTRLFRTDDFRGVIFFIHCALPISGSSECFQNCCAQAISWPEWEWRFEHGYSLTHFTNELTQVLWVSKWCAPLGTVQLSQQYFWRDVRAAAPNSLKKSCVSNLKKWCAFPGL